MTATTTVTATVAAATRPIWARIGRPESTSAARAMTTVVPAKTTALPAVATERGDRLVQVVAAQDVAAVPVDDEQRVVDADGEPEHQGERRGHRVEVGERREGDGAGEAHADAEQGDEQRKAGGDEAAEHDDEHDEGDGQAETSPGPMSEVSWVISTL